MFDPHTARFLSPDLFVQDPAFTQSFNRYSYCLNNPLRFVDPGGYWWNGLTDRVFHDGQTDWSREVHAQKRHQDGGSGGYSYDSSSPTGYRNASGDVVSWGEVYNNYVLPNSTAVDPGLFYDVLLDAQSGNLRIINMYGQDWFVYVNPSSGKLTSYMSLTVSKLNSYYKIPQGQGGEKSEPWLTVNFNRGIPQIETNFTDKDWGAITPGPFIVYPKGGSKDKYYNTHEPGHVVQFLILGPVAYYGLVAIPSLITSTTPYHSDMPWEKSANQLWYWLTGENDPRNPLYFGPNKK